MLSQYTFLYMLRYTAESISIETVGGCNRTAASILCWIYTIVVRLDNKKSPIVNGTADKHGARVERESGDKKTKILDDRRDGSRNRDHFFMRRLLQTLVLTKYSAFVYNRIDSPAVHSWVSSP